MSKIKIRERALILRNEGKSYSQIKNILGISKSTLSLWLRKYPLSQKQMRLLRDFSEVRIEKFRQTMQHKKDHRLNQEYIKAKAEILPLSERELLIAGFFLYWGEGSKTLTGSLSVSNSDPKLVKFALYWFIYGLKIPKEKVHARLHLYKDMQEKSEISFWSRELSLPISHFGKSYIKSSNRADLTYKSFGHGTCNLYVSDARVIERVLMSIKAIADRYSDKN